MKKFFLVLAVSCMFCGCGAILGTPIGAISKEQFSTLDSDAAKCFDKSVRGGVIAVDLLLLGVWPIIIDIATSSLTYFQYNPYCLYYSEMEKSKSIKPKVKKQKVVYPKQSVVEEEPEENAVAPDITENEIDD